MDLDLTEAIEAGREAAAEAYAGVHGGRAGRPPWNATLDYTDAAVRAAAPIIERAFLHASRVPLRIAPIDRTTRGERLSWQTDIFDHLEDGDPDGCTRRGCRSGAPA